MYVHVDPAGPKVPPEKHRVVRGLVREIGRSSKEEKAFEMRLDSFQLNQTASLKSGRYFLSAY